MASDKKPSIYSDRGNIGSAEELDEYGVWVKSEPQDLTTIDNSIEELGIPQDNFDIDISEKLEIPDTPSSDFNDDFEDLSLPADDVAGSGDLTEDNVEIDDLTENDFEIPTVKAIENDIKISEENFEKAEDTDLSTQLLRRIAGELSSIRNELSELKKEFAGIHFDEAKEKSEQRGGFFSEEEDETIALTGDELSNIISVDEDTSVDTKTDTAGVDIENDEQPGGFFSEEEDETIALTGDELDNILNTADFTEESGADENLESDFPSETEESAEEETSPSLDDDLDIDIDIDMPKDTVEEELSLPSEETVESEDDFGGDISFDEPIMEDESPPLDIPVEEEKVEEEIDAGNDELDVKSDEEIDIDIETPPASEEAGSETTPASEADDDVFSMDDDFADISLSDDLSLDDSETEAPSMAVEDDIDSFSIDEEKDSEELEKLRNEGALPITPAPEDTSYLEEEVALSGPDMEDEVSPLAFDEMSIDDPASIDLSEAVIDEPELSLDNIPDEVEEPSIEEMDIDSFEDLSSGNEIDDIEIDIPEKQSNEIDAPLDDLDFEIDEVLPISEQAEDDISVSTEEPQREELSEEDISLLESDLEIPEDENELPAEIELNDDDMELIPEHMEAGIEKADIPFDDDEGDLEIEELEPLEIAGETPDEELIPQPPQTQVKSQTQQSQAEPTPLYTPPPQELLIPKPASGKKPATTPKSMNNIPSDLKAELKTVLSYMDQLLESLPEEKIEEFAKSEYFDSYKKLFKELGLV